MIRTLVTSSLVMVAALVGSGCTSYAFQGAGAGVTLPTAGPVAMGPLGRAGHLSIEGSLQENDVPTSTASPSPGAGEARAITTVARTRVSYTLPHNVEVGVSAQVTDNQWSHVTSTGSPSAASSGQALFGAGTQARWIVIGTPSLGLGVLGEASVHQASYAALGSSSTSVLCWECEPPMSAVDVRSTTLRLGAQIGLFGVFPIGDALRITLGGTVGTRDVVETTYSDSWFNNFPYSSGSNPSAPFATAIQLTGFASAGYTVGPVTLLAQLAVNAYGESPLGGTVGVRITP